MAAVFELAIPPVLDHEGGWVNDPNDHGGATNWGVSLRYLIAINAVKSHPELDLNHDGQIDWHEVQAMTKEEASSIYKSDWWDAFHYGQINDQRVATKILDMSINMGHTRAHKMVQQALNSCGKPVGIDGALGNLSFAAINQTDPAGFLHILCQVQASFYRAIVAHDPNQSKFLKGWLRRAAWC